MPTPSITTISCIIHCRVSSAKQSQEGESLDVQESICLNIGRDNGWTLAHAPWKESYSGRKNRRPVFEEILEFVDEHPGLVQRYLFRSIDRFTRGGTLAYEQMKRELARRGVAMVDSYGIIQPVKNTLDDLGFEYEWSKSSPSEIAEVVVATSAKNEVTNILTRLIGQEIRLTQRGYKIRQPEDGYANEKVHVDGKKHTIQKPDPERAKYYIAIFNMRASGQHTDKEICERLNAMGYRTRSYNRWDTTHQQVIGRGGGHLLTPKRLQLLIQRPIYCGVMCEKWTRYQPIKAQYDGLVSINVFNAANRGKVFIRDMGEAGLAILYDHNPEKSVSRRNRNNPTFPFKNVVLCPHCRKPFTGSSPRNKIGKHYPTYHCARKHRYFGVPKATLDAAMERFIQGLRFRPETLTSIHAVLLDRYRDRQGEILQAASNVGHTVAQLEAKKGEAVRAFKFASTGLMRQALEEEAEDLAKQIQNARVVRGKLEINEQDIEDFIAAARRIMEHPADLLESPASPQQQQALYSLVFEQLPTYHEIVNGTPKLTWIFYLSSDAATAESVLVRLQRFGWNTIEHTIVRWRERAIVVPALAA